VPKQTQLSHLGYSKETTWGTSVAPTVYAPFNSFKWEPNLATVVDNGKRGNITKDYNEYPTTKSATADIEMNMYPNEVGPFLLAALGSVTTTGASAPYTHAFKAAPTARSMTIDHFNGSDQRRYAGMVVDEVTIKGDAEGVLTFAVKLQGKYPTVVTTTSPSIAASISPIVGAFCSLTIGGTPNTNLFGFEVTIKRSNKLVFGANTTQDPTKAVNGALEVTGKLTFDVEDNTEFAAFEAQTTRAIVLTLGSTANNKATITLTSAYIEKASFDDGDESLRVDWEFRGLYNATDAGPCVVSLVNTTASY
jgi:hypothetical protein